jgi:hypothetical protein
LAELVGCRSLPDYEALNRLLVEQRPDRYRPSIYRCSAPATHATPTQPALPRAAASSPASPAN